MPTVYIAVGSNLGDRYGNVDLARSLLEKRGVAVERLSPLYETSAECKTGQDAPDFVNGVFEVKTDLDPEALLEVLEEIERGMGRRSKGDWSPRPIDLDILLYGDRVISTDRLKIPHPEMSNRWFVMKPLADLAPDVVHPVLGKNIKEMLWNFSSTRPT